jgi:ABC-type transport system involved in multi-copper enzyme maturation permease subunit
MPASTSGSLSTWIVVAFGVMVVVGILFATKGKGSRDLWHLVKVDPLVRTICIAWIVLVLIQSINVFFSSPWKGTIVLFSLLLNIVMLVLVMCIFPGRLAKKRSLL